MQAKAGVPGRRLFCICKAGTSIRGRLSAAGATLRLFDSQGRSLEISRNQVRVFPGTEMSRQTTRVAYLGLLFAVMLGSTACAQAAGKGAIDRGEVKTYALKLCLDGNYEKLDGAGDSARKDKSFLLLEYQLDNLKPGLRTRLQAFVRDSTENYALAQVPMKDEAGEGPFNEVFAQCVKFQQSPELERFLDRSL